ncbi:hypothetical protein Cni_G26626 [Canna indica]|uniref:Pentatricopeptide repeat-containing protein n=1 Tax=Canna indica TaxID=4628 RepID=A0AAQ3QQJ8_9LILI|nr:hypothetical protein Cni_G26626 [Canna indica]
MQRTPLFRDYLSHGFPKEALLVYTKNLPNRNHQPILPLVLKACTSLSFFLLAQSLHADSVKIGIDHDLLVGTSFLSMYSKCHQMSDAIRMFEGMPEKNVVAINAMINGYSMIGEMESALALINRMSVRTPVTWAVLIEGFSRLGDTIAARCLFDQIPNQLGNVVTWTVMVHGYTTNGEMDLARTLFDMMLARNAFVWSSMITGYFKKGDAKEAEALFDRIPKRNLRDGFKPDEFTVASLLSACGQLASLHHGKKIHELIKRRRIKLNHFVLNGLVDMYAKCEDIEKARSIFNGMSKRNTVCWNSMISGLASHGRSEEALELFTAMEESEEKPN